MGTINHLAICIPAAKNRIIFGSSSQNGEQQQEDNEVADHIRTLSREGSNLDPDIAEIVGNTLEMGQLKVQDIMVSRKQVQILDVEDGLEKNLEIARTCGHTACHFAKVIWIIASVSSM